MAETTEGIPLQDALRACLEHAKQGRGYGVRPIGITGIAYAWASRDGEFWELRYVDARADGDYPSSDDTYILGGFEVVPAEQIEREWPLKRATSIHS